ncbi:pre-rRNA-processing protein esf1 [Drosophila subobscura]|uniref:pre-rRNA-processing protein esf1 n=1 Tax=Drosophila subobscura TaxID=7241 RepID=UPI00155AC7EC|nr:pre-rRNA-processing protein esf1 [Drosophila subobscura]
MVKKKEKSAKGPKKAEQEGPTTSAYAAKIDTPAQGDAQTGIWGDARFQHLLADPRFKGVPKVQRKVKIDKRFQGMFTDDKFKVKYTVDKYGRPVNTSNAEDLRKFYELDENDSDEDEKETEAKATKEVEVEEEEQKERRAEELAIARVDGEEDELENDALDSDGSEVPENLRERLTNPNVDYARGEGRLMTDSSSDDDTDDDEGAEGPELQIDHVWGELDNDAETTEESTRRLAICNMDWDRIRAEDLMVLLSSFLPLGGSILSVKIYPSEYGKARLAEEEIHGPAELVKRDEEEDGDSDEELVKEQDSDAEEGDDYHMEKLRQYQLNRLRYYYAVAECDSVATADKVYKECDGIEYESSATRVDLRFIPDDTSFEEDTPKDECSELPDASNYKPRQFTTTALQQAKVDLTWDETALDRRELGDKLSSGQVDKLTDKELRQIVAYSSEEDEDDDEENVEDEQPRSEEKREQQPDQKQPQPQPPKKLSKQERIASYKNLLAEILQQEKQEKEHKYEMEMSWNIEPAVEAKEEPQKTGTATAGQPSELTPIEKVIQKRSEKNKLRKEMRRKKQIEARGGDPEDSDDSSVPDGIDMNDAYFAEEFANGDYEPPKTKKQGKKRNKKQDQVEDAGAEQQQQELALLLDDGDGLEEKQHFSLKKILKQEELDSGSSKRKRRKQLKKAKHQPQETAKPDDDFTVDLNDTRFKAVYKSHEYNIDPTHSHYKATKGMQQIIGEKLKRRERQVDGAGADERESADESQAPKRSKQQLEQSALVKSLKRKLQQQQPKL